MITISIATFTERKESLRDTIKSLIKQVDKINVYANDYKVKPDFLDNEKINFEVDTDLPNPDIGDLGKFYFNIEEGYHLTCDDDLIYPSNYVSKMIEAIDEFDRKAIITYCGNSPLKIPVASYYRDRIASSLFVKQNEDLRVVIPGTGVMGYHTDLIKNIDFSNKEKNMADIHMGIYAKENKIPIICKKHSDKWIKHTTKIDMKNTIYEKYCNSDLIQTDLINDNFGVPVVFNETIPKISVVIVNTRQDTNIEFIKQCYDSVKNQIYFNIEIIIVKNYDKKITIGKAWNDAIKKARGDWILFLGDDDYISPDYVNCLAGIAMKYPDAISITSHLTMFMNTKDGLLEKARSLIPTGMWNKKWLLENPCKEYLTKFCDTDMFDRMKEKDPGKQFIARWHYGYYYRAHKGQTSGFKAL